MNGLVIINPSSGMKMAQRNAVEAIHRLLASQVLMTAKFFYTRGKNDARLFVRDAEKDKYDFVLAVGGDGTINEVVTGLVEGGHKMPLAILPAGTTNDFATSLGLPTFVGDLCEMIKNFKCIPVDIGKMNDSYFLNVAAGGAIPEVAHKVPSESKTYFGKLAYYVQGGKELANLKLETKKLAFEIDGKEEIMDVFFFILANSRSVGGFQNIAPKSKVNDGKLDLCIVKKLDLLNMIPVFSQILTGAHVDNNKYVDYRQVSSVRVRALSEETYFPLDVDGEESGELPFYAEVVPEAINLIIPGKGRKINKLVETGQGNEGKDSSLNLPESSQESVENPDIQQTQNVD